MKNLSALQKIVGEMQGGDQGIGCWREPPAASWALTWPPSSSGWRALLFQTASSGPSKNIFGVLLCKYEMLLSYWCGCSVDFSCSTYSLCNSCMILLLCSTHIIQIIWGITHQSRVYFRFLDFHATRPKWKWSKLYPDKQFGGGDTCLLLKSCLEAHNHASRVTSSAKGCFHMQLKWPTNGGWELSQRPGAAPNQSQTPLRTSLPSQQGWVTLARCNLHCATRVWASVAKAQI